jgi:hypothetical protein
MKYAKLTGGVLDYAKHWLETEKGIVINPKAEAYLAAGYKPVIEEAGVGERAVVYYEETETEIRRKWRVELFEPAAEETETTLEDLSEVINAILGVSENG